MAILDTQRADSIGLGAALSKSDRAIVSQGNVLKRPSLGTLIAFILSEVESSVQLATTANITLSGEQTIDGVLTAASRVMVKAQTDTTKNGLYVSAAGAWSRAPDMDAWDEVPGTIVRVEQGTVNAETLWLCSSDDGGTLETTPITFINFTSIYQPANAGLTLASVSQIRANSANRVIATFNFWSVQAATVLTDAATIAVDFSAGINFSVTLEGNRTLGNPTNVKVGQSGMIKVLQDGTGGRTLAYGTNWKFIGGVAPVLTTAIAARDVLRYYAESATVILCWFSPDMK